MLLVGFKPKWKFLEISPLPGSALDTISCNVFVVNCCVLNIDCHHSQTVFTSNTLSTKDGQHLQQQQQ